MRVAATFPTLLSDSFDALFGRGIPASLLLRQGVTATIAYISAPHLITPACRTRAWGDRGSVRWCWQGFHGEVPGAPSDHLFLNS